MGNGMNKVIPGLFLGSCRDGKDQVQLDANQITHIISIHDQARKVVENKEYLCIRVPDSPDENLTKYFAQCNDFIHGARIGGGNVLIHCLAGVSRSATITAAYLMSITSLTSKDALKVVKGARSIANPNYGFLQQLREFEIQSLLQERRRLQLTYPEHETEEVRSHCQKMIKICNAVEVKQPAALPQATAGISPFGSPKRRQKPSPAVLTPNRTNSISSYFTTASHSRTYYTPYGSPRKQKYGNSESPKKL